MSTKTHPPRRFFKISLSGEDFTYIAPSLEEVILDMDRNGYLEGGETWRAHELTGEELAQWSCTDEDGNRLSAQDVISQMSSDCECVASTCHA